jgi:bleomycin hydrolase
LGDIGFADFQIDSLNTKINQDTRDNLYENWKTTDVHNVQIIGIAKDERGIKYYKIKDSVSKKTFPTSPIYFSENYFRARVLSVLLHKDGIPPDIKNKLKL